MLLRLARVWVLQVVDVCVFVPPSEGTGVGQIGHPWSAEPSIHSRSQPSNTIFITRASFNVFCQLRKRVPRPQIVMMYVSRDRYCVLKGRVPGHGTPSRRLKIFENVGVEDDGGSTKAGRLTLTVYT